MGCSPRVDATRLTDFAAAVYASAGMPEADARLVADTLVQADLWGRHLAPSIVVTGGRRTNDRFTEATASALYLERTRHVPDTDIIRIVNGRNSWESNP